MSRLVRNVKKLLVYAVVIAFAWACGNATADPKVEVREHTRTIVIKSPPVHTTQLVTPPECKTAANLMAAIVDAAHKVSQYEGKTLELLEEQKRASFTPDVLAVNKIIAEQLALRNETDQYYGIIAADNITLQDALVKCRQD